MCRLHLKHAEVYKAKIKSFVDDAPLPKQVVNAKQQRLVDIVWSHETFAKELLLNEHHPFKDATERQLVLRMLENSYTKKQFHQQVADAKQLQSDLVQPERCFRSSTSYPRKRIPPHPGRAEAGMLFWLAGSSNKSTEFRRA